MDGFSDVALGWAFLGALGTWGASRPLVNSMSKPHQPPATPAEQSQQAQQGAQKDLSRGQGGTCSGDCGDPNNKWKGRGTEYEKHVKKELNASDNFRAGGREFDGSYTDANGQTTWYDAKSSWDYTNDPGDMQNFKSTTGQQAGIAANNGANFAIVTPVDPPANIQSWLNAKGIPIVKVP